MRHRVWGIRTSITRRLAIASLAIVVIGTGGLAGPTIAAARNPTLSGLVLGALHDFPALGSFASTVLGNNINLGTDGRLTVLILGSDHRYSRNIGERTDAMMVATIDPSTKQIATVSIPRDTGNVPLPDPTDTYHGKVNSLFAHYKREGMSRDDALDHVRKTIAYDLDVEIDYVFFARFEGFDAMVDAVGGVPVDIPAEIHDPRIYDASPQPHGAKFLAGTNQLEQGTSATPCYATARPINWSLAPDCHHALMLVRSRHGTVGTVSNSDWKRDARQQQFMWYAIKQVISNGNGTALTDAAGVAGSMPNDIYTTLPITDPADLLALYDLFNGSQSIPIQSAVLKPNDYASRIPGTSKYALKLTAVRALTASWFAPVP